MEKTNLQSVSTEQAFEMFRFGDMELCAGTYHLLNVNDEAQAIVDAVLSEMKSSGFIPGHIHLQRQLKQYGISVSRIKKSLPFISKYVQVNRVPVALIPATKIVTAAQSSSSDGDSDNDKQTPTTTKTVKKQRQPSVKVSAATTTTDKRTMRPLVKKRNPVPPPVMPVTPLVPVKPKQTFSRELKNLLGH
ncbi:unnamed protein product [Didymodactylos carnosus]|uniref:Uncharacterized protein n=1 Tax=Didymodactylos carnosus TaxID=1234261 RepID=A0A815G9M4_9BILA|nr:unnamed protein product [Didymodactylos carnosus]CAF4193059.1 unnamed protein product [Didymodactylos carnosus]